MLHLAETRFVVQKFEQLMPGVAIYEEGCALVYAKDSDGATKVQLSTGGAGENALFAGVAVARNTPPSVMPIVNEGVVDSSLKFTLPRTPIVGQLLVRIGNTITTIVAGAPANADEVKISGSELTFHAGAEGQAFSYQMLYVPTVQEARSVIGDMPIGGLAANVMGQVGVIKNGWVGTNMFNAGADWATALYVKVGADGTFDVGTAADHIPNVVVRNSPNVNTPFLVLSLNVA